MSGADKTGVMLFLAVAVLVAWDVYAAVRLPAGSTISAVVGKWLHDWPPLLAVLTALFCFSLWHFWHEGGR